MEYEKLVSSKYIEEFVIGEELHHGCVQITPYRNKEYIKKFKKSFLYGLNSEYQSNLGYNDPENTAKKEKFNIGYPGLVSQGYIFNVGFGLSVHDISFNAIANLSYKNLKYVEPVYEGDVLFGKSKVIGIEVKKDGASNGSVQVKTTITNQRDEVVIEYVRQVLLRATPGVKMNAISDLEVQPEDIDLNLIVMPKEFKNLNKDSLFRSYLELPSNVITGQFEVKILHYRNSKLVSQQINSINVSKSGISAEIYDIAQNYSTLYGVFAVLLAVLVGWGSNLIFRKVWWGIND